MITEQIQKYLSDNGATDLSKFNICQKPNSLEYICNWGYENITQPTEEQLPSSKDTNIWVENRRQLNKPLVLKIVENKFLMFCDLLTQGTNHTKLGFDQLGNILEVMLNSDPNRSIVLSVKLLAIDAEAKREGGNLWWDDCTWHSDI